MHVCGIPWYIVTIEAGDLKEQLGWIEDLQLFRVRASTSGNVITAILHVA